VGDVSTESDDKSFVIRYSMSIFVIPNPTVYQDLTPSVGDHLTIPIE